LSCRARFGSDESGGEIGCESIADPQGSPVLMWPALVPLDPVAAWISATTG